MGLKHGIWCWNRLSTVFKNDVLFKCFTCFVFVLLVGSLISSCTIPSVVLLIANKKIPVLQMACYYFGTNYWKVVRKQFPVKCTWLLYSYGISCKDFNRERHGLRYSIHIPSSCTVYHICQCITRTKLYWQHVSEIHLSSFKCLVNSREKYVSNLLSTVKRLKQLPVSTWPPSRDIRSWNERKILTSLCVCVCVCTHMPVRCR